jgi:hypothetical protein
MLVGSMPCPAGSALCAFSSRAHDLADIDGRASVPVGAHCATVTVGNKASVGPSVGPHRVRRIMKLGNGSKSGKV